MCERWVEDWTKTATYWPLLFWLWQHFFPILLGCSTGSWGPSFYWVLFSLPELEHWLQTLIFNWSKLPVALGYITIRLPPASCERHISHSIQPVDSQGYPLISSTGFTCYLHKCISHLTAWPGWRSICYTYIYGSNWTVWYLNWGQTND